MLLIAAKKNDKKGGAGLNRRPPRLRFLVAGTESAGSLAQYPVVATKHLTLYPVTVHVVVAVALPTPRLEIVAVVPSNFVILMLNGSL